MWALNYVAGIFHIPKVLCLAEVTASVFEQKNLHKDLARDETQNSVSDHVDYWFCNS